MSVAVGLQHLTILYHPPLIVLLVLQNHENTFLFINDTYIDRSHMIGLCLCTRRCVSLLRLL